APARRRVRRALRARDRDDHRRAAHADARAGLRRRAPSRVASGTREAPRRLRGRWTGRSQLMSFVLTEEVEPGIVLVTMNRPERLNALSQGLIAERHATFERIHVDRDVRVVILTGAGRGFCSGDDLKGVEGEHGAPGTEGMNPIPLIYLTQEHLASLHERIHRLRQPVIAAVNGAAVGGGFAMALAGDIRFAAESA